MTQIIGLLTENMIYVASDRMVTYQNGDIADEKTCKIVSFCQISGLAFSGLAELDGRVTNEWIAVTLAKHGCNSPADLEPILKEQLAISIKGYNDNARGLEIMIAGWSGFYDSLEPKPYICIISNCMDERGKPILVASEKFNSRIFVKPDNHSFLYHVSGETFNDQRQRQFEKTILEHLELKAEPKEIVMTLNREIIETSIRQETKTVGANILSMCLPKYEVLPDGTLPQRPIYGGEPDYFSPTFHYFEKGYNQLMQYGPTKVCKGIAANVLNASRTTGKASMTEQFLYLPEKS
jgi:hypothetical protein